MYDNLKVPCRTGIQQDTDASSGSTAAAWKWYDIAAAPILLETLSSEYCKSKKSCILGMVCNLHEASLHPRPFVVGSEDLKSEETLLASSLVAPQSHFSSMQERMIELEETVGRFLKRATWWCWCKCDISFASFNIRVHR